MTDSPRTELRWQGEEQPAARVPRHGRPGKRARYQPSAQVVEELARLGPDLGTIADELRSRLTEPDRGSRG